jgi:hypothetical protein
MKITDSQSNRYLRVFDFRSCSRINIYMILFITILGCIPGNKQKEEISNDGNLQEHSFYSIDFYNIIQKQKKEVCLSEISETIEYIPLETPSACLLGEILDAKVTKDFIFIKHNGTKLIAQFDRDGKFKRNIGKIGKGPGEYLGIREFSIDDEKNLIFIQSNWTREILVYTFKGEFIKSIKSMPGNRIVWSRDSLFMSFGEPMQGNEKYVFTEINSNGETTQVVNNYYVWSNRVLNYTRSYWGRKNFYRINNQLHFKGWYNDTVYTYNSENKIIPKMFIDLKGYKLPDELRPELVGGKIIPPNYYWISINETLRYVFILYSTYDRPPGGDDLVKGYIYFDKYEGHGYALPNDRGKFGFINDLNGGPEFIPDYTSDSVAIFFFMQDILKNI